MKILFVCLSLLASFQATSQTDELSRLYKAFDLDGDRKITLDDKIDNNAVFELKGPYQVKVRGLYEISNLAQELKYSELTGEKLRVHLVNENPVDRISRSIREIYWDGLTRRIDPVTLPSVIPDTKISSEKSYLYIPYHDDEAWNLYSKVKLKNVEVVKLPEKIKEGFITSLGNKQGLLSLAVKNGKGVPYVVPGGRFNEMYGWDSYFHVLGVLNDKRPDLAKGMIENLVYEIQHYGKILNANRSYYLSRSQPPFLTSMITAYLESNKEDKAWIENSLSAAIQEYEKVWMGKDRLTKTGLSRYAGFDSGIPPEVEEGHFDHVLKPYAKKYKLSVKEFADQFNRGLIKDKSLIDFFHQDRAVRESGHDTTYRWRVGEEDRASDFVTVDLNALIYKYELDLAQLIRKHFNGKVGKYTTKSFEALAEKRKALIRKYLWNDEKKLFFDYNWKTGKQSEYLSATSFYPLWAADDILSPEEAKLFVKNALRLLEEEGGLAATSRESWEKIKNKKTERQWDYPNGWAPHQMIAWRALQNYRFHQEAERLTYKWLYMITLNASNYNGTIPEKFNVKTLSHKVFAEYGNVGTKFSYITLEGFGWMNASYQVGLALLPEEKLEKLKKLRPHDEALFK